ncbi:hypothetical protein B0T14DRAFT_588732 [Immersiella caudata]|uniref:Heterokaryon incompatibility domain-containing protein n=1 Tax=Immersiella caudata TaxID=314043 RepID=A0AA39WJL0_9PEZI|nr:hypothetical protein B0T14DRAFT_588732 [Immersiella caudata]
MIRSTDPDVRRGWRTLPSLPSLREHNEQKWRPLLGLLDYPWWRRVWIIQEVALSCDPVWLHWGKSSRATWDDVATAFLCWERAVAPGQLATTGVIQSIVCLIRTQDALRRGGVGVRWLLHSSTFTLATNTRDMVCAMLGMASSRGNGRSPDPFITPDYRVDVALFYQRAMEKLLDRFPKLYALSSVGLGVERPNGRVPGLPSWVVDWTTARIARARALTRGVKVRRSV